MAPPNEPELPIGPSGSGPAEPGSPIDLSAIPTFLRSRTGGADAVAGAPDAALAVRRSIPMLTDAPDPATLPMASVSPRRLLQIVAIVAIAWGVISFGRQVVSASAASAHAAALRGANTQLQDQVSAMQGELALVQDRRYVDQQARAYRLGTAKEIPFALQAGAPALSANAPGSAANRLGVSRTSGSPLDHWLALLFGPG